ncbi:MAG: BrxA/BrxB family bacilliredoxin [Acidobacteria bacterium]|nr:BrxA/BrxB family bacilliredoxin [Acidobacteriota bacterium]MCA1612120.1 BrxA/BrxB family bacilliredoxin [Acidobacteriota bacterium]
MPYPPMMVQPMREELTRLGFRELVTPEAVDSEIAASGEPMLLVVNSICGCAAGVARPGVALSLSHPAAPKRRATVFAGQDVEATARARSYFEGFPPSSPQIAILSGGRLIHLIQRQEIEGRTAQQIASVLEAAYEKIGTRVAS